MAEVAKELSLSTITVTHWKGGHLAHRDWRSADWLSQERVGLGPPSNILDFLGHIDQCGLSYLSLYVIA